MTYRYAIDGERRRITATIEGDVTCYDLAELIRAYRNDPAYDPGYDRLWDGHGIRSFHLDPPGLRHLTAALHEEQPHVPVPRAALVVPLVIYHDMGLFVRLMGHFAEARVFLSMDAALAWLRPPADEGRAFEG